MKKGVKTIILTIILILLLLVWAPWITNDYAINKVVEKLGGPDARFNYLGQDMAIRDIPIEVGWLPFCRFVTFPGEAGWFVSFYGDMNERKILIFVAGAATPILLRYLIRYVYALRKEAKKKQGEEGRRRE